MSWDSSKRILRKRRHASDRWVGLRREAYTADHLVEPQLPGYFVDRYAFRELPFQLSSPPEPHLFRPPISDRARYLASIVKPANRLGGWAPLPEGDTDPSDFYGFLVRQWAGYCRRIGLPDEVASLRDARLMKWGQVLNDTIFYPAPPVFKGATFIDALDDASAGAILPSVGIAGVIDFYCFMLQVHETVHRHQTGEPLLNEVVQAALWARFLSEESLWTFQRGANGSLVREITITSRHEMLVDSAAAVGLDTAAMITSTAAGNAYFACCLLANRFDHGVMRYAEYLERLDQLLVARTDHKAVRALAASML